MSQYGLHWPFPRRRSPCLFVSESRHEFPIRIPKECPSRCTTRPLRVAALHSRTRLSGPGARRSRRASTSLADHCGLSRPLARGRSYRRLGGRQIMGPRLCLRGQGRTSKPLVHRPSRGRSHRLCLRPDPEKNDSNARTRRLDSHFACRRQHWRPAQEHRHRSRRRVRHPLLRPCWPHERRRRDRCWPPRQSRTPRRSPSGRAQ